MLSEEFGDFSFDDADFINEKQKKSIEMKPICPLEYEAVNHCSKWFLDTELSPEQKDVRELTSFKAALAYYEKDFNGAVKLYKEMLEIGDHKSSYRCAIIDSIIRSALKSDSANMPAIVSILHDELLPLISTYGEQLQYWTLSLEVYKKVGGFDWKYLQNAILLCASIDLAEHWIMLADVNFDDIRKCLRRFQLGCLCRAFYLLQLRSSNSRGFIRKISENKAANLRQKLCNEYSVEEMNEAKLEICMGGTDIEMEDSRIDFPPPHDCKMKGMFKDDQQQRYMISKFLNIFDWLFGECWQTVVVALVGDQSMSSHSKQFEGNKLKRNRAIVHYGGAKAKENEYK